MDDLKMLRDLGAELEHQPPATMVRQRTRLLAARPRRRRVGWLVTALAAAATAVAVAVPAALVLNRHESAGPPVGTRPAKVTGTLNILVVGTDSQAGSPRFRTGARSDLILLAHLPADRKRITFVSLPRDSIVSIPRCGAVPARKDMINSAFDKGGLSCTVKTVETLTDVRIDHSMEFDFTAFEEVVDAVGGVEVTLPRPVDDPKAKLTLPVGKSVLNGEQALAYMRLRNYGDGSDIQRIRRQQMLLEKMLGKARRSLGDPAKLRAFLSTATKSIKTDMDLDTMLGVALSARKSSATFLTVPWQPAPDDPNRVIWKQPETSRLFERLR